MARSDEHRQPGGAQRLDDEAGGVAGDMVVFEEVATAGEHVGLGLPSPFDDPLEGGPKVLAASLRADAIKALAREGSIEMQVSEMEQAKGHKSPVTTRIVPGAMAYASAKAAPIIKVALSLFRSSRRRDNSAYTERRSGFVREGGSRCPDPEDPDPAPGQSAWSDDRRDRAPYRRQPADHLSRHSGPRSNERAGLRGQRPDRDRPELLHRARQVHAARGDGVADGRSLDAPAPGPGRSRCRRRVHQAGGRPAGTGRRVRARHGSADGRSTREPDLLAGSPDGCAQLGGAQGRPHLVPERQSRGEAARDRALFSGALADRAQQLRGGARSRTEGDANLQTRTDHPRRADARDLRDPRGIRFQPVPRRRLGNFPLGRAGRSAYALLSAGGGTREGIDLASVANAQRRAEGLREHDGHRDRYRRDHAVDPRLGRCGRGPRTRGLAQEDQRCRYENGRAQQINRSLPRL